jgi:hypothetical protein
MIHLREQVARAFAETPGRAAERIEYADIDVVMRIQRGHDLVDVLEIQVIDEHAHLDSAIRRVKRRAKQQLARVVLVRNVVLHVERLGRRAGERDAGLQRLGAGGKQTHAGLIRMRSFLRQEGGAQGGGGGGGERVGGGAIERGCGRTRGAGGERQRRERGGNEGQAARQRLGAPGLR